MRCSDCGRVLRYADKKYPTGIKIEKEATREYRCRCCYYENKEKESLRFRKSSTGYYNK